MEKIELINYILELREKLDRDEFDEKSDERIFVQIDYEEALDELKTKYHLLYSDIA